jgi:hypothetical protein
MQRLVARANQLGHTFILPRGGGCTSIIAAHIIAARIVTPLAPHGAVQLLRVEGALEVRDGEEPSLPSAINKQSSGAALKIVGKSQPVCARRRAGA